MRQSQNSHLHKQKDCAIVVERKAIYPLYADKRINQRQNDISTEEVQHIQDVMSAKDADNATIGQMPSASSASTNTDYQDILQWATGKQMVTIGNIGMILYTEANGD